MINLSQADSSCWLRKKKSKTDVTRETESKRKRGRGSLEARLMDSRLHQSDKRDSRALIPPPLSLSLVSLTGSYSSFILSH